MKSLVLSTVVVAAACSSTSAQPSKPQSAPDIVATVGSKSITVGEVDEKALQQPAANFGSVKLSQALYEARRQAIDDVIADLLMDQEAKSRGVERSALVEKEIADKVAPVTDIDVA